MGSTTSPNYTPSAPLNLTEAVSLILLTLSGLLILTAYGLDLAGWPIALPAVTVLALVGLLVLVGLGWRGGWLRVRLDLGVTLVWLLVVGGLFIYLMALAWPTFLPLTESSDSTHHASYIDFIAARHMLAHDPSLDRYLGEMTVYPAGAHILGALAAQALGVSGLRVLHPLLAVLVALKAGLVLCLIARLLPPPSRHPAVALAGSLLLLVPVGYFIRAFTGYYFFPMVISETFAVAALWAMIVWDRMPTARRSFAPLGFFALYGTSILLIWPTWLPIVTTALGALVLLRRGLALRARFAALTVALLPVAGVGMVYALNFRGDQGVLTNEGAILKPSLEVYTLPLLGLLVVGCLVSLRNQRVWPIFFLAASTLAALGVLWELALTGHAAFYIAYKMFYLLQYPIVILAGLGLAAGWDWLRRISPPPVARRWALVSLLLPLIVLGGVWRRPPRQEYSTVREPVYQAGLWAKANLPNGCLDYLVDNAITAYWLHVYVLGNPRGAARADAIVDNMYHPREGNDKWRSPPDLPFAVVENLDKVPKKFRTDMRVLFQSDTAAVVERAGACQDATLPLDRYPVAPRDNTLARLLSPSR